MLSKQGWVGNQQDVDQQNADQQNADQRDVDQRDVDQRDADQRDVDQWNVDWQGPEFLKPEGLCCRPQLNSRRNPAKPPELCAFKSSLRCQEWIRVGTAKSTFGTGE
jgi:hypothetical protein